MPFWTVKTGAGSFTQHLGSLEGLETLGTSNLLPGLPLGLLGVWPARYALRA